MTGLWNGWSPMCRGGACKTPHLCPTESFEEQNVRAIWSFPETKAHTGKWHITSSYLHVLQPGKVTISSPTLRQTFSIMSRACNPEETRHPGREKLSSWRAHLSQLGIRRQSSETPGDSHADPAPVAVEQPDNIPKREFPVEEKRRTARSRLFMKAFPQRNSRKRSSTKQGPASLAHEQPDEATEQNVVMREYTVDQDQASEEDAKSEIRSNFSLEASRTLQEGGPRAVEVEEGPQLNEGGPQLNEGPQVDEGPQAGHGSPVTPDPAHQAEDRQTILAKSIQIFADRKPKLFELLKDQIEHFQDLSVERWDTWSNIRPAGQSESPQAAWVSRCKARLPAFSAVKGLAIRVSALDPHGLAPYIVTGSFVAIEVCDFCSASSPWPDCI